ncbi:hypothetical protein [Actinokineospora sp. HUAS TT18]|uniref:hypothetical protein n=1 Tax=Actinokineospora sp. HUAS TT18 TaxID=3447451 RepID=UPI003F528D22
MSEVRLHTKLRAAQVTLSLQSAVATFGGRLGSVSDTMLQVSLDPYAPAEKLKALYADPSNVENYRLSVVLTVYLATSPGNTELVLTSRPSVHYMVDALGVSTSTMDAFVRTVDQTLRAVEQGQRPPDRPPPPR